MSLQDLVPLRVGTRRCTNPVRRATVLLRVYILVAFCATLIGGGAVGAEVEIAASVPAGVQPPSKVCPCGDLTGSGRDLAWLSGV